MSHTEPESRIPLRLRRATPDDLPELMRLEVVCFPSPWPESFLSSELAQGDGRVYIAAEVQGELVGYAGMWCYAQEAHIGTLAVAGKWRRTGLGEMLVLTLLDEARRRGCRRSFLEYRVNNEPAARLYRKLGFALVRIRKGYYADTDEDAAEVAITDLGASARQQALADLAHHWLTEHNYELAVDL